MSPEIEEALVEAQAFKSRLLARNSERRVRLQFVRKVYGILISQLLVTCVIAYFVHDRAMDKEWRKKFRIVVELALALKIAVMCSTTCCPQVFRMFPFNYLLLLLFTIATSFVVGFATASYSVPIVIMAVGLTAVVFIGLTMFAFGTRHDFTGYGPYISAALMVLFTFGFAGSLFLGVPGVKELIPSTWEISAARMLYCALGALLFSAYVVYDTQCMLGALHGHSVQFEIDDYCLGALQLYIDIINLFMMLLKLLGEREE